MTDEVERPEVDYDEVRQQEVDEADWAMRYAEERKLRMKAQTRLASFMLDAPAFCIAVEEFIDSIFKPMTKEPLKDNPDKVVMSQNFMKALIRVMQYSDDLGHNISLNIYDAIWEVSEKELKQLHEATSLNTIPKAYRERVDALLQEAGDIVRQEWTYVCEDSGHLLTPDQQEKNTKRRCIKYLQALGGLSREK